MNGNKEQKLLILGAGDFAEDIADLAQECGFDVIGFVENKNRQRCQDRLFDRQIYWIDDIAEFIGNCKVICSLGTTFRDGFIDQVSKMGFTYTTLVHPSARVSTRCDIGTGSIISAGAIITAGAKIGKHVLINRGSLIGHHVHIGDFTSVGPGANLGGNCKIAEKVYLGMGSIIRNNCSVGKQAVIGAGAVVIKNIPARVQALGLPAEINQEDIEGM